MPPETETTLVQHSGLQPLDYAAVVVYLLLTLGIAIWFGRLQKNTEDFFVGGRRMPWFAVGLSILATLFSTLSYLGVPGEMIKQGIAMFLGYLAIPLTYIVISYVWIPFFMRLKLTSAYEYLERRFSYPVRLLGAMLFILLRLGWMSMVVFAASLALDMVKGGDLEWLAGPDIFWAIGTIGVVAAIYTAIGGIQAVIWVDVLQCILLLVGVIMAIGYVVVADASGPLEWWAVAAKQAKGHTAPVWFTWDLTVRSAVIFTVINSFFWNICTHGSDQVVLQRYFSTSSLKAARRSYLTNVIVDFSMVALLSIAGLALLALYIKRTNLLPEGQTPVGMADKLYPYFLGHQLPAGCAGLVISAFLCDAIQTLESGVNAITAVVTKDLLAPGSGKEETAQAELTAARRLTVFITVFVTGAAYGVGYLYVKYDLSLVDMMPKFFNMFVGPLAAIFFVGMFLPRCTTRSVLPAALCGLVVAIIWSWWEFIFQTKTRPTIFLSIAVPCTTTFLLSALLSFLFDGSGPHSGSNFTWWSVVKGTPQSDQSS
ncbi:MAG: sodium/solute symporter [Planctomycetales bacterium]|nr:sodium/solute symporter [Planctomycetales bacterium]